jgi:hypothetical protein
MWTIADFVITITEETEMDEEIDKGDFVKVDADITDIGCYVAREIALLNEDNVKSDSHDPEDETEMMGMVESISDKSWCIGGAAFLITPQTEIDEEILTG